MTKLRLSAIPDDRPVKIAVELPPPVFRDLQAYAAILAKTTGGATRTSRFSQLGAVNQQRNGDSHWRRLWGTTSSGSRLRS